MTPNCVQVTSDDLDNHFFEIWASRASTLHITHLFENRWTMNPLKWPQVTQIRQVTPILQCLKWKKYRVLWLVSFVRNYVENTTKITHKIGSTGCFVELFHDTVAGIEVDMESRNGRVNRLSKTFKHIRKMKKKNFNNARDVNTLRKKSQIIHGVSDDWP